MKKRHIYQSIADRVKEPRRFMQVLLGPRQVGKTTLALQIAKDLTIPTHYVSADTATLGDTAWLKAQWQQAREKLRTSNHHEALLIIDEIQKVPHWSSTLKALWDEDTRHQRQLKVFVLGSSPWLIQQGIHESLAGRFEIIPITHWTFSEMAQNFGWTLEHFIYFGGYPGAAPLADPTDVSRWKHYINESLIETTLSRDILLMTQINKPALLRRLFQLGCTYSGQILSYQKMLGQLQDAGNTTTLAHYLKLLGGVGLLTGIEKYAEQAFRQKRSSPRFMTFNNALLSSQTHYNFEQAQADKAYWGRLVESCVGSHLLNTIAGTQIKLFYWRERNQEVDFILRYSDKIVAIEVKSGQKKETLSGLAAFNKQFNPQKILLVGEQGIPLSTFLQHPATYWLEH